MDPLRMVAAGEAATGVVLLLFPQLVVELLLGSTVAGAGLAAARIAGIALLAMGIACWPGSSAAGRTHARTALLVYNALATVYLGDLAIAGNLRGPLLWPAVILHLAVTAVLAATSRRALSHGTTWRPPY